MKRFQYVLSGISIVFFTILSPLITFAELSQSHKAQLVENYGKIPLSFTVNQGQFDSKVKFTTRGNGCTMFFTQEGTTFLLSREKEESVAKWMANRSSFYGGTDPEIERESFAFKVKFLHANPEPEVVGNDPSQWRTDAPHYAKIRLRNLYDGVNLVYYSNKNELVKTYIVGFVLVGCFVVKG